MSERAPSTPNFKDRSKEKLVEMRKRASEKMGRSVSGMMFNLTLRHDLESFDLEDEEVDNLKEQHYQDQKETREYYKDKYTYLARRLGAYAMFAPGANRVTGAVHSFKVERNLQKKRRDAYKLEHGTAISNTKKQWATGKARLNALAPTKASLAARKSTLRARQ
jgi:hypothetical protein